MMTDDVLIGTMLDIKEYYGWSSRKLAREIGISPSAISRVINGASMGSDVKLKIYNWIDQGETARICALLDGGKEEMGRKELEKVVFDRAVESVTQKRAEAANMDYTTLLEKCGASSAVWETSRKSYRDACGKEGWDSSQNYGMMRADLFDNICMGFMLNASDYVIVSPPAAPQEQTPKDGDDMRLLLESIHNQQKMTNQLLREIRAAIDGNTAATRISDVVSKVDRILGCCNAIKDSASHLPEIKKKANTTDKAVTSIDQRLNGINQIVASNRVGVDKIKIMVERFVSGK